jgi:hypothetical protein
MIRVLALFLAWSWALGAAAAESPPRALIVPSDVASADSGAVDSLRKAVSLAGYQPGALTWDALLDEKNLRQSECRLLVIPNGRALPIASIPVIQQYLHNGGHMMVCGLPLWADGVAKAGQRWTTRSERAALLAETKPRRMLADFAKDNLTQWRRSSDTPQSAATYQVVSGNEAHALHVVVGSLTGWDNFGREFAAPFRDGDTLTCFRAKGDRTTRHLMIEWQENDSSRWIATVELSQGWRQYALPPEAFKAWEPGRGHGGPGDRLHVQNAHRLIIGVAYSHMPIQNPRQEYWVDTLGTAPNPIPEPPPELDPPHLESLSPAYQFFPISGPVQLRSPSQDPNAGLSLEAGAALLGIQPRPGPAGVGKNRPWLRQVLLEAVSPQREYRGAVATLTVALDRDKPGGAWVAFTPTNAAFYREPSVAQTLVAAAHSLRRGLFLAEGGANCFTTLEGQSIRCGAEVINLSSEPATAEVRLTITAQPASPAPVVQSWTLDIPAQGRARVEEEWTPPAWPAEGYQVVTELLQGGAVAQRVAHDLHCWKPRVPPDFVEIRDGSFRLEGRSWKVHGVNYMPSSGIGLANRDLFEYWLGPAAYDPVIIQRDLERIRALNMNAVSVFLDYRSLAAQNLLDLLRMCGDLGLRVNLSLRPGTPLDFRWPQVREMIETLRLAENATIFAYDLAWEPSHYDERYQRRYAPAWREWIGKRYGAMDRAEQVWGVPARRLDGQITVPAVSQLATDGPWRRMVADYRCFLDDFLAGPYAEARRLVRSIDSHHAISFRMQLAGDPTHAVNPLPYDFYGLRDAVDLWEPEGYGRVGDWERVKPGAFTAAYARLCDPHKPVLWAEMGVSVWDSSTMAPCEDRLQFQARFYTDFYRMLIASGADGVFAWWYPGGYRVDEQSDFGIINPDGTNRAVTQVIRESALRFLSAPKPSSPDCWIAVDRDADARGLVGLYDVVKDQYWRALGGGHQPGLRWVRTPGLR